MSSLDIHSTYADWLKELKERIKVARIKVALAANGELIRFYWDLGRMIVEKQAQAQWGDKIIAQLSKDLQADFPDMRGLSERNIKYCRQFYQFYSGAIGQQPVAQIIDMRLAQIPWGHNIIVFTKSENQQAAFFYIEQTIENGWSRDVLALQIKSNLFKRQGNAITNFQHTLPHPQSDLAQQTLKDPYIFDFLTMDNAYHEKDIENQLLSHITKFLLELGKGFAFVGKQYHITVGETDYYIDLLFYHVKLKCFVVIELKNTKFIPEYAGKLNFYLSAVDSLIKTETDNATIGILLCRDKNNFETEFALRDINKPMGVSEFQLTEIVPEELKSSLPTVEEIEQELKSIE
jgi:predicted nuclease of restriction endonuclease-like (RecB) superfamily